MDSRSRTSGGTNCLWCGTTPSSAVSTERRSTSSILTTPSRRRGETSSARRTTARVFVRRRAGRTLWPSSSIPRRAAGPASSFTRTSCHGRGHKAMTEGQRASGEAFLRGRRVRLRPLERVDLPRYQELFSEPEINLFYGGLGVPENLAKLQRRYDAGEYDTTDRFLLLVIEAEGTIIGAIVLRNTENLPSRS